MIFSLRSAPSRAVPFHLQRLALPMASPEHTFALFLPQAPLCFFDIFIENRSNITGG